MGPPIVYPSRAQAPAAAALSISNPDLEVVDDLIGSERAGAAPKSRKFYAAGDDMIRVHDEAGDLSATTRMRMSKPYAFGLHDSRTRQNVGCRVPTH
jgi:hypothetical protein